MSQIPFHSFSTTIILQLVLQFVFAFLSFLALAFSWPLTQFIVFFLILSSQLLLLIFVFSRQLKPLLFESFLIVRPQHQHLFLLYLYPCLYFSFFLLIEQLPPLRLRHHFVLEIHQPIFLVKLAFKQIFCSKLVILLSWMISRSRFLFHLCLDPYIFKKIIVVVSLLMIYNQNYDFEKETK